MTVQVRDFLKARRDRAVGTILGYAEREVYPSLRPDQQTAFRSLVLEAIDNYHDTVLDIVKSDTGEVRNDEILSLLEDINAAVQTPLART